MNPITRKNSLLGLSALILTGCAGQLDTPLPDTSPPLSVQLAVLSADTDGSGTDIVILDSLDGILDIIETDIDEPVGLSAHPSGDMIVTTREQILRVTPEGEVSDFNQEPLMEEVAAPYANLAVSTLWIYRAEVSPDGYVTVASEFEVTEWDAEGGLVMSSEVPQDYCWVDAAPVAGKRTGVALLDLFGPTISFWDNQTGSFEDHAVSIGSEGDVLGYDTSGNYYVASQLGPAVHRVSAEGETTSLSAIKGGGIFGSRQVVGVHAIEPAGPESVFILVDEPGRGSSILRTDVSTRQSTTLATANDGLWLDMTLLE